MEAAKLVWFCRLMTRMKVRRVPHRWRARPAVHGEDSPGFRNGPLVIALFGLGNLFPRLLPWSALAQEWDLAIRSMHQLRRDAITVLVLDTEKATILETARAVLEARCVQFAVP